MPKLSAIPKVWQFQPDKTQPPLMAIVAASKAEARDYVFKDLDAIAQVMPATAFELGVIGVPLHYAKPEYRNDGVQPELPLGQEVSHAQPE